MNEFLIKVKPLKGKYFFPGEYFSSNLELYNSSNTSVFVECVTCFLESKMLYSTKYISIEKKNLREAATVFEAQGLSSSQYALEPAVKERIIKLSLDFEHYVKQMSVSKLQSFSIFQSPLQQFYLNRSRRKVQLSGFQFLYTAPHLFAPTHLPLSASLKFQFLLATDQKYLHIQLYLYGSIRCSVSYSENF
jgi:hypothetical protein